MEDKLILGYVEDGDWAIGSNRIVIDKARQKFGVFKRESRTERPRPD